MKIQSFTIYIAVAMLFKTLDLGCQTHTEFQHKNVRVEGRILNVYLEDLNCDSTLDILVLHSKSQFPSPHYNRYISIFFQKENQFPDDPTQTISLNAGEILFDIGNIDEDPKPEIVFLTSDGIYARKYASTEFTQSLHPVLKASSVFLAHDPLKIRRSTIILDLNGDTIPEFLIPKSHELRIYSKRANREYDLIQRFGTSPNFSVSSNSDLTFSLQLPSFELEDFNGDGVSDLLALHEDRLDIYFIYPNDEPDYIIPLIPPNLRYKMGSRNMNPSVLEPLIPELTSLEAHDLNADGLVDIALTRASRASLTTNISQIQVFMNKNKRYETLPDQILTAENFSGEHVIQDFNQDGLLDIAILRFKIGFTQAIKFLLTKKAANAYDCYFMRPNHVYPIKPDARISFSRRLNLDDVLGSGLCQSFNGDFDGDGVLDLLIGTDYEEFTVFPGTSNAFFTKKSSFKIDAPISNRIRVEDYNRDGISDILLWYPQDATRSNLILLIQSQ